MRFCFRGLFLGREADGEDGAGRTFIDTLAACFALVVVDVGEVVLHGDGLERTHLGALATTYTSGRAVFLCHSTLLLIVTGHIDTAVVLALVADFKHAARTSVGARLATHAEILDDLRKMRFGVEVNGVELAGGHTVAAAETSKRTSLLTGEQSVGEGASERGIIERLHRRMLTGAVTAHGGDLRLMQHAVQVHDFGDLVCVAAGTVGHAEVVVRHNGLGHGATAGETATAAVGIGQTCLHQIDARVLLHMEELRYKV